MKGNLINGRVYLPSKFKSYRVGFEGTLEYAKSYLTEVKADLQPIAKVVKGALLE